MRRKMLKNCLAKSGFIGLREALIAQALEDLSINAKTRAEELSLGQFVQLSDKLLELRND